MSSYLTYLSSNRVQRYLLAAFMLVVSTQILASERDLYANALRHYDSLLKIAVDQTGVKYDVLKKNQHAIEHYLYALGVVKLGDLQKKEKLALFINAYNAFTLRLILDYWPNIKSIKDIPEYPLPRRFKDKRWKLGGELVSLNDIEKNYIGVLETPAAYMALVCATRSCPDLKSGVYSASIINKQLIDATKKYLSQQKALRWGMKSFLIRGDKPVLYISELFRWEKEVIEYSEYTVLSFIEEFAPVKAKRFIAEHRDNLSLVYLDYDWRLNASQ